MLLLLSGSSGAGKTYAMPYIKALLPDASIRDSDEFGIPTDKPGRQERLENCVKEAIRLQNMNTSLVLCCQSPFGELLACPSAHELDHMACCVIDCNDHIRIERLNSRGDNCGTMDMLSWASWHRMHAIDPQWRQDVIRDNSWDQMCWHNWTSWLQGDQRWKVDIIDTSFLTGEDVAERIVDIVKTNPTNPLKQEVPNQSMEATRDTRTGDFEQD